MSVAPSPSDALPQAPTRPWSLAWLLLWALVSTACTSSTPSAASQVSNVDGGSPRAPNPSASGEPASDPDSLKPRASVFVVHHAADFDAYLAQFAGNKPARDKAGVTRAIVLRLADDTQRVGVHFSAGSRESVDAFLKSSDFDQLVEANEAADSTVLWVATDELDELPATVPANSASLLKKFKVKDVACVKVGLTSNRSLLEQQGLLGFSLHRTDSDAQTVILHLVAPDVGRAEQIYGGAIAHLLNNCGAENLEKPVVGINQKNL